MTMTLPYLCISILLVLVSLARGLPMQLTINQRATECLYDLLDEGEHATMSVFILSGAELRATATLEGPIAPPSVDSGSALQDAVQKMESGSRHGKLQRLEQEVDFEHFKPNLEDDDDDDESDSEEDDGDGDDPAKVEKKRQRAQAARQKAKEKRKKREEAALETKNKIREEGEPFEATIKASRPGWYRACVKGSWYQIVVEMEMRKESELGGVDKKTGHVYTKGNYLLMEEEKLLQQDTASQEEGIKDEDFETVRGQLKKLRKLLSEIQGKQSAERHRLVVHASTNEHSHSRMVMSSLMETILFMAVTGFQVYTIRKWFSGSPQLGR